SHEYTFELGIDFHDLTTLVPFLNLHLHLINALQMYVLTYADVYLLLSLHFRQFYFIHNERLLLLLVFLEHLKIKTHYHQAFYFFVQVSSYHVTSIFLRLFFCASSFLPFSIYLSKAVFAYSPNGTCLSFRPFPNTKIVPTEKSIELSFKPTHSLTLIPVPYSTSNKA